MKIEYLKFCMPNKWTFEMDTVRSFIFKFIKAGSSVLVPFAGKYRFPSGLWKTKFVYNDIKDDVPADYHVDAYLLKDHLDANSFDIIIADPPYSSHQCVVTYQNKQMHEVTRWRMTAKSLLKPKGLYIELGYNSNGIRGYKKIALGIQPLGGSHNDILILVQQKPNKTKTLAEFLNDE